LFNQQSKNIYFLLKVSNCKTFWSSLVCYKDYTDAFDY